jgi:hypothetical protein
VLSQILHRCGLLAWFMQTSSVARYEATPTQRSKRRVSR